MTVALDAFTGAQNLASGAFTVDITAGQWVHTPVGTPRGVLFLCGQGAVGDQIASISYGGVDLIEVSPSPFDAIAGDEDGTLYCYFLGSGIPTGAVDVLVDTTNSAGKRGFLYTLTASGDTEVDSTQTLDVVVQNPSLTLATTASTNTWVAAYLRSGIDSINITPGTDFTEIQESDAGTWIHQSQYRTTNATGGNVTVDWGTNAVDDAQVFAVAIKESGGAAAPRNLRLTTSPRRL